MGVINLVDAFRFWKATPGQIKAAEWLNQNLTEEQKNQFAECYREPPPAPEKPAGEIYLYAKWQGKYDNAGGKIFGLYLMNGEMAVDKVAVCSGLPESQNTIWPLDDYSGSMQPCSEGLYDIGRIDDLGYDPDDHDGYGRYVIFIEPRASIPRGEFRIHVDWNRAICKGSAGCLCPYNYADILKILGWLKAKAAPKILVVDHGLGFLEKNGVSVPAMGKV
jgi:hypothetical protein